MEKNNQYLGTEPLGKLLFKLAVPSVVAQIINMLYNIVDRIYIGHMPEGGSLALTGLGVCMPIIMVVSAFAALVSMGGAPRASIAMGRGDNSAAERILGNCFILQIIISAILTSALLIWDRDLLLAFGASPDTIGFAAGYMDIYALGTIFVQLTLGMNAFITAQGFSKTGMYTVLIGAVSNIILDPVFIFGLDMGVRGAALATVISQCISCLWVLLFLRGEKTILRLKKENMRLEAGVILPCLALGLAAFIMQSSESIISVSFNTSLLKYGGDIAVGAMTILSSINMFAMLPPSGPGPGRTAHRELQLRRKGCQAGSRRIHAAAQVQLHIRHGAVAHNNAVPASLYGPFHPKRGACGIYSVGNAALLRGDVHVRHTGSLPDDLYRHRQRKVLHSCCGGAKIRAAPAPYIPHARPVPGG